MTPNAISLRVCPNAVGSACMQGRGGHTHYCQLDYFIYLTFLLQFFEQFLIQPIVAQYKQNSLEKM